MTEKQFMELVTPWAALQAAKEAGAKFDPEPVELPIIGIHHRPQPHLTLPGTGSQLTGDQLHEVVRRCNAWPRLRGLLERIDSRGAGQALYDHLQAILDGRP